MSTHRTRKATADIIAILKKRFGTLVNDELIHSVEKHIKDDYYTLNQLDDTSDIDSLIASMLNIETVDIKYVLDDIKSKCEYMEVVKAIESYKKISAENNSSYADRRRDRDNAKKAFYRKKKSVLEGLGQLGINDADLISKVKSAEFNEARHTLYSREFQMKIIKGRLNDNLMYLCRTGKQRAGTITKDIFELLDGL